MLNYYTNFISKAIFFVSKTLSFFFRDVTWVMRRGIAVGIKRRFGQGLKPKWGFSQEEKFLLSLDLNNKIVYDIGAYIGLHTLFFARKVGKNGSVVSFEPNPSNYIELISNIQINDYSNIQSFNMAIGRERKEASLINSTYSPARGKISYDQSNAGIKIIVESIDDVVDDHEIKMPDFIKIDVEGSEMDVLFGSINTIRKCKPDIFIELHNKDIYQIISFLKEEGYKIYNTDLQRKNIDEYLPYDHIFCCYLL